MRPEVDTQCQAGRAPSWEQQSYKHTSRAAEGVQEAHNLQKRDCLYVRIQQKCFLQKGQDLFAPLQRAILCVIAARQASVWAA